MKTILCVGLTAIYFAWTGGVSGADADLIDLIKEGRKLARLPEYLQTNANPKEITNAGSLRLKKIHAFGAWFAGELNLTGGQAGISLWTEDAALAPQAGVALFNKLAGSLTGAIGAGKAIADIPNYGDASDVKSMARLWSIGGDVVLLQLDRYPSRAGVSVVRCSLRAWRGSMGADESDFWAQTLAPKAPLDAEPQSQALGKRVPDQEIGAPVLNHNGPPKVLETESPATQGERPASSRRWSIIALWIIAAIILVVSLYRRRS